MSSSSTSTLAKRLGYQFNDNAYLELALTHRSVGGRNNERIEFLGDSIVNFIIGEALFRRFPEAREGQLSRLRARLVKGETLADVALEFELGQFLKLGSGEMKSGGNRRRSILADAMEAVIGAIYLDGGMDEVKRCVLAWFAERLNDTTLEDTLKDPKTRLQEFLQSRQKPLPRYDVVDVQGDAHDQVFTVEAHVELLNEPGVGTGSSRRNAEQQAADKVLALLQPQPRRS
ncbi:ribonuclease III [Carnimonas bestiolae]|uniref:ribonuclease III n=1 Tax=Carnimonas bestiolae TaxID=3402172 RepID=UPI003EDC06CC